MAARIIPITIQRSNEASSNTSEKSASPPAPPSTASTTSTIEMAANSRSAPISLVRNRSIEDFNEQVVNMLDDVEKRVEQLR
ncbi:hypothetical protein ANCCAN_17593 [Ancylostoma caninum]|uniref:Uncharacterized protein n=1 Tax=Ancylostoma caninum TaxID=29170 RepID=A0A368G1P2_ANCCA|nr:hypothetical protein ANCCAN_17593 [Ancylostoma caninum]